MSNEPKLAKYAAIGLGAVEFIIGLIVAGIMLLQGMWLHADPKFADTFWWPSALITIVFMVLGPPFVAWLAERSTEPRTVWLCLAVLLAYPIIVLATAQAHA